MCGSHFNLAEAPSLQQIRRLPPCWGATDEETARRGSKPCPTLKYLLSLRTATDNVSAPLIRDAVGSLVKVAPGLPPPTRKRADRDQYSDLLPLSGQNGRTRTGDVDLLGRE